MAGHGSSTRTVDVLLRDVAEGDLSVFFEHQRDPAANRMFGFPSRDWDAFAAHWYKILANDSVTKRTVLVDGRVAGNVVRFEQDGEREVGYWIGEEYWGKGVVTEALSQFLGHAESAVHSMRRSPSTTRAPYVSWRSAASPSSARRKANASFD